MPATKFDMKTIERSHLPTSFTDFINIAVKQDGIVMLRTASITPEKIVIENHRTVMQVEVAKDLAKNLCQSLDYYPSKPAKRKSAPKK